MYHKYQDLAQVRTFLEFDKDHKPCDQRLKICVAALLYKMAESDHGIVKEEMQEIIYLLDSEFHLMDDEAQQLVEIAGFMQRESASKSRELEQLEKFLGEINQKLDRIQRTHLLDMIWRVAEADKIVKRVEREFAQFLKKKMGLDIA